MESQDDGRHDEGDGGVPFQRNEEERNSNFVLKGDEEALSHKGNQSGHHTQWTNATMQK